jgi:hypothetical protein
MSFVGVVKRFMYRADGFIALVLGAVTLLVAFFNLASTAAAQQPRLFEHVDLDAAELPDDQAATLARIQEQNTTGDISFK